MSSEAAASRRLLIIFATVAAVMCLGSWALAAYMLDVAKGDPYYYLAFMHLFVRYDFPTVQITIALFAAALLVGRLLRPELIERVLLGLSKQRRLFAFALAVLFAILSPLVYQNYPLALDEHAPWFQAQIFASGHIYGQYPPELVSRLLPLAGEFIRFSPVSGQTVAANWPAYALLMTPFMKIGAPWLLNAIAGGAILLLLAYIAERLVPESPTAPGWAMLLGAASPVFVLDAISYYTMNLHLLVSLAYMALLLELTPKRLVLAGLVGTVGICLNNPLPHFSFALPWIVWLLWSPNRWRNIFFLGLGYSLTFVIGPGWLYLQSQLPQMPVAQAAAAVAPAPTGFTLRILQELKNGAIGIPPSWSKWAIARAIWASKLYFWAVPGLALIAFLGYFRAKAIPQARLLGCSFISALCFYAFVKVDQGHGWGARYFHPVWGALPLFGAVWLVRSATPNWHRYVMGLALLSAFVLTPLRLGQAYEFISEARANVPPHDPAKRQMIFVDRRMSKERYYAGDAIRNDPFMESMTISLDSQGPERDANLVQQAFPGAERVSLGEHGSVWNLP